MRRVALVVLFAVTACGGSIASQPSAKGPESSPEDRGFSQYVASHGIATLSGGGGAEGEASADGLRLEHLEKDRPFKIDGIISEWPPLARATLVTKGNGANTSMAVGLMYDDAKLYIGADIGDPSFVAGQSHVAVTLAIPQPGGGYATDEIDVFPGKPGESEGSVRVGQRATVGARVVEALAGAHLGVEATVPWGALSEARTTRVGIHGTATYVGSEASLATGPGDARHPASMPWVPSEPELSLIEQLLTPKGLAATAPQAEAIADLTGDGARERVAVFDRYLTICGASFLGGTGYFYRDLGGELVKLEVRDVTGRGRPDVIVRRRVTSGSSEREYLEVLSVFDDAQEPRVTFAHEIEVRRADRHVDNAVHIGRGEIDVSVEPAQGWDAASYSEPIATDVEPVLLPWGSVRAQVFRWDGSRFARAKETLQRERPSPGTPPTGGGTEDPSVPPRPPEPATPPVSRGGDLSADLLDAYRRDRGLPAGVRPKVDLQVQVGGDDRPERVLLLGRDIVVFGPGFQGGSRYVALTLAAFADARDIHDLTARDLTGDGDADLVVRGVRHVTAGTKDVDVEVIVVYQVGDGGTISRVFAIEVGADQGRKRVQGLVQFIPSPGGKSFDVVAAPGRAVGWTRASYPWPQRAPASGGDFEPLLLPWGRIKSVRYAWNGSQFAKVDDDPR